MGPWSLPSDPLETMRTDYGALNKHVLSVEVRRGCLELILLYAAPSHPECDISR
jgi:hypothetical protein